MDLERMFGIVGIITGVLFIIGSFGLILLVMFLGGIINTVNLSLSQFQAMGLSLSPMTSMLSDISNLILMGWIYSIIEMIAGVVWIIIGVMCLSGKE